MTYSHLTIFGTRKQTLDQLLTSNELTELAIVQMEQRHGDSIHVLTKAKTQTIPKVDAVITQVPDVVLVVRSADCVPILISHPSGLMAALHCGRKSTELGLLRKVLEKLKNEFAIKDNLTIKLGPAICERCYQIESEKDVHYNLVRKNFQQAMEVFPDGANVSPSNMCTAHQNENYFSYRKEGKLEGRNYSLITVKP